MTAPDIVKYVDKTRQEAADMKQDMILILDLGSEENPRLAREIRDPASGASSSTAAPTA